MTRLRLAAVSCIALTALVGCGSTVQVSSTGTAPGSGSGLDGATGAPTDAPTVDSTTPTTAGTTSGGTAPGGTSTGAVGSSTTSGGSTTGSSTGSTTGSVAMPPAGTSGRGFNARTLTVGVVVLTGGGSAASTFGISGSDTGDGKAQYAAVASYINKHGGIAGRKLDLVPFEVDIATALANPDQSAANVCAAFTQDRKVFAVLQPLPTTNQRACLARASTPMIEGGSGSVGQPEYDKYPDLYYGPGRVSTDRLIKLLIASLQARSFFSGWDTVNGKPGKAPVKLGLLYPENPDAIYQAKLEIAYLKAIGLKITDTITYSSNVQAGLAATQNAILKFKADGITHVLGASAFFLQGAENQHYRPRYVLPPGIGQLYAANSPAVQMAGSMTVGWQPAHDVNAAQDPGDVSPAGTLCKAIMKAAGQSYASRQALAQMQQVCDVEFFLRDALASQVSLSNTVLRTGAEALGGTWKSAQTFVSRFSPTQHASADAVRDQAFDPKCSCVYYVSKTNRTG